MGDIFCKLYDNGHNFELINSCQASPENEIHIPWLYQFLDVISVLVVYKPGVFHFLAIMKWKYTIKWIFFENVNLHQLPNTNILLLLIICTCRTKHSASQVGFPTPPNLQKIIKSDFTREMINSLKSMEAEMPWHWSKVTDTRCWRELEDDTCTNGFSCFFCTFTWSQRGSSSVSTSWRWSSWSLTQWRRSCKYLPQLINWPLKEDRLVGD